MTDSQHLNSGHAVNIHKLMFCRLALKETNLVKSIAAASKLFQIFAIRCDKHCFAMFEHQFIRMSSCNTVITDNNY